MSDRRIVIGIDVNETRSSGVNGVESVTTNLVTAAVPPKVAAATLRALADELDPPTPPVPDPSV